MSFFGTVRSNWRILLLVTLLVAATFFLFFPGAPIAGAAADSGGSSNATAGVSNIQFGIDLAGGARISAPANGYLVTDVDVTEANQQAVKQAVANATGTEPEDVVTSVDYGNRNGFPSDAVEIRAEVDEANVTRGLEEAGLDASGASVQPGVSDYTIDQMVSVLDSRLGESGFAGGSVTRVRIPNQPRNRVRIEAPGQSLDDLESLVAPQGQVKIVAHYPNPDGEGARRETLVTQENFEAGTVQMDGGDPQVPVTLTQSAADDMTDFMQESGFARGSLDSPSQCASLDPAANEYCLLTVVDNETVYSSPLSPGLAQDFESGAFRDSRSFVVEAPDVATAQDLLVDMRAGALPTTLDIESGTQALVSPALAEDFRRNSLLTGIIAVLAVVVTVFARYGDPRVAVPMAATALSEVVILLGFAAAIGWPLELSHVAGFIAVIGTGVDDLIIIADEVKSQGDVTSQRVFQNRFRKAFWVIGAAAATTIVAMSPLAILDLGQLRGFAIITILGVLIGVAVSRPAYGSILRSLTTSGH
jgi:preprotein translocase subunit SecD